MHLAEIADNIPSAIIARHLVCPVFPLLCCSVSLAPLSVLSVSRKRVAMALLRPHCEGPQTDRAAVRGTSRNPCGLASSKTRRLGSTPASYEEGGEFGEFLSCGEFDGEGVEKDVNDGFVVVAFVGVGARS